MLPTVRAFFLLAIVLIAGCANHTRATRSLDAQESRWLGRLALKVHSDPVQAFSADFDLQGDAQSGTIVFFTPIGSTAAKLQWDRHGAQLQTNGNAQQFDSLDDLTRHATGASLPIASMFAWLKGIESITPDWTVDLRGLVNGRLHAQRIAPQTPADLKIILDLQTQ